jgi:hypothetical protein
MLGIVMQTYHHLEHSEWRGIQNKNDKTTNQTDKKGFISVGSEEWAVLGFQLSFWSPNWPQAIGKMKEGTQPCGKALTGAFLGPQEGPSHPIIYGFANALPNLASWRKFLLIEFLIKMAPAMNFRVSVSAAESRGHGTCCRVQRAEAPVRKLRGHSTWYVAALCSMVESGSFNIFQHFHN